MSFLHILGLKIPYLNLVVPTELPNVSDDLLDPRASYEEAGLWEAKAKKLSALYIKNFEQYCNNDEAKRLIAAGPSID